MEFWKKTTLALLMGIMTLPAMGMQNTIKSSLIEERRTSEFEKTIEILVEAQDEHSVNEAADTAMQNIQLTEDYIQGLLNNYRQGEQHAYNKRAYAKGFDYQRLYKYQEGYDESNLISPNTARGKFVRAPLNQKIVPFENLLKEAHSLMSLLEQCREAALAHVADQRNKSKHERLHSFVQQLLKQFDQFSKNPLLMEIIDSPKGFEMAKEIGSDIFNPEARCPDRFIIGKQVTALFPNFAEEGWNRSFNSRDMRTGRPKEPMTQIRLQNKLWDVFANTKENQPNQLQNNETMVFLDEKNTSKRCVYKFNVTTGMGQLAHHPWWGQMNTTYSILLIPAKDQNPEPRDRSYDEVPERLEEEIKGERLKTGDTTNPEESRAAVNEEMRQRLARRDFEENRTRRLHRRGIPMDQENEGYLMPSDIRDQTYMRVHVPDYRYGRAYARAHNFVPSTGASRDEMMAAQTQREDWEVTEGHSFEDVGKRKDY